MMSCVQAIHLFVPLISAFCFLFFQMEIIQNTVTLAIDIFVFLLTFVIYGVACYLVFHIPPGYEDQRNKSHQLGINNLFEYKSNQQRRQAIYAELMKKETKENPTTRTLLQQELITLYTKNSFCEICKFIKSPRSHHCKYCDKCVLRMEYHCKFLEGCVGEKNHKIYIQYLLSGIVCTFCISISCLICLFMYGPILQTWSPFKGNLYALLCSSNIVFFFIFLYLFLQSIVNIKKNITSVQKKIRSFREKNPFIEQDYYSKIFPKWRDFFDLNYKTDGFQIELIEQRPQSEV